MASLVVASSSNIQPMQPEGIVVVPIPLSMEEINKAKLGMEGAKGKPRLVKGFPFERKKFYENLLNFLLAGKITIKDLETELGNGRLLILLIDLFFGKKPNFRSGVEDLSLPTTKIQSSMNLNWVVDTLTSLGISSQVASVNAINSKNAVKICEILYRIFMKWICGQDNEKVLKTTLVKWCHESASLSQFGPIDIKDKSEQQFTFLIDEAERYGVPILAHGSDAAADEFVSSIYLSILQIFVLPKLSEKKNQLLRFRKQANLVTDFDILPPPPPIPTEEVEPEGPIPLPPPPPILEVLRKKAASPPLPQHPPLLQRKSSLPNFPPSPPSSQVKPPSQPPPQPPKPKPFSPPNKQRSIRMTVSLAFLESLADDLSLVIDSVQEEEIINIVNNNSPSVTPVIPAAKKEEKKQEKKVVIPASNPVLQAAPKVWKPYKPQTSVPVPTPAPVFFNPITKAVSPPPSQKQRRGFTIGNLTHIKPSTMLPKPKDNTLGVLAKPK